MGFIVFSMSSRGRPPTRPCEQCSKPFSPPARRPTTRYCGVCRGKRERASKSGCIEDKARIMIAKTKNRAKNNNLPFEIDALWIVMQWYKQHGRCSLSGRPMTLAFGPCGVSLERINSDKGYTRRNTVLVALQVNSMKSDMKLQDFLDWCRTVTEYSESKGGEPLENLNR